MSLAQYDFAVAVIPADHERHEAALAAIYIEIGVAVARSLPLIVIAGTSIPASPALAGNRPASKSLSHSDPCALRPGPYTALSCAFASVRFTLLN